MEQSGELGKRRTLLQYTVCLYLRAGAFALDYDITDAAGKDPGSVTRKSQLSA